MPDITMCKNKTCELRHDCFAFMAEPNPHRQSYFAEDPQPIDGRCDYFMNIFSPSAYGLKNDNK